MIKTFEQFEFNNKHFEDIESVGKILSELSMIEDEMGKIDFEEIEYDLGMSLNNHPPISKKYKMTILRLYLNKKFRDLIMIYWDLILIMLKRGTTENEMLNNSLVKKMSDDINNLASVILGQPKEEIKELFDKFETGEDKFKQLRSMNAGNSDDDPFGEDGIMSDIELMRIAFEGIN